MLSEVLKESPISDYVKPKRRVRTTSPAVKKAYKKGYLNKKQETFTREECEAKLPEYLAIPPDNNWTSVTYQCKPLNSLST